MVSNFGWMRNFVCRYLLQENNHNFPTMTLNRDTIMDVRSSRCHASLQKVWDEKESVCPSIFFLSQNWSDLFLRCLSLLLHYLSCSGCLYIVSITSSLLFPLCIHVAHLLFLLLPSSLPRIFIPFSSMNAYSSFSSCFSSISLTRLLSLSVRFRAE